MVTQKKNLFKEYGNWLFNDFPEEDVEFGHCAR